MSASAQAYARRFVLPQADKFGDGVQLTRPWGLEIIGPNIEIGNHVHINSAPGYPTKLCTWKAGDDWGRVTLGDYVLISPGTQIISSRSIVIGANTMIASGVYISDSDWHGTYDRLRESGAARPIVLEENVWISVRAIIGKGVTIGRNSIVGAGSVVTKDIPPNVIAAGNPATVKRELDPAQPFTVRAELFAEPEKLNRFTSAMRREQLKGNSTLGWARSKLWPRKGD